VVDDIAATTSTGAGAVRTAEASAERGYSEHDRERWLPEQLSNRRSDIARDRARLLQSSELADAEVHNSGG